MPNPCADPPHKALTTEWDKRLCGHGTFWIGQAAHPREQNPQRSGQSQRMRFFPLPLPPCPQMRQAQRVPQPTLPKTDLRLAGGDLLIFWSLAILVPRLELLIVGTRRTLTPSYYRCVGESSELPFSTSHTNLISMCKIHDVARLIKGQKKRCKKVKKACIGNGRLETALEV